MEVPTVHREDCGFLGIDTLRGGVADPLFIAPLQGQFDTA
jgi:hypothetical protein